MELKEFKELGLTEVTLEALRKKGFEEPSPIQALCIPRLLQGDSDIIGQAQTGTGKTAAFSLPIIEKIKTDGSVKAIVLAPTRELVIQVAEEINSLKGSKRLSVIPVYGGVFIENQIKKLKQGIDIVVGTPGRIIDLLNRKKLEINNLDFFILDEADEMLNMGFLEDITEILKHTNEDKKMLFFSATMPKEILEVAKKHMKNPEVLSIKKQELTTNLTEQIYFEVSQQDKFEALCRIIDIESEFYGIIFCKTKNDVDEVANKLISRGYDADCIHGDISQNQRERVLGKFKTKNINLLVATDVAARGIDVNNLTHVINYSLPQDPESYVHRIGRTGRAGNEGTAITFVSSREYRKLSFIETVTKTKIKKQEIPDIKDVISAKKLGIKEDLQDIISKKEFNDYKELAEEILKDSNPAEAIAGALKLAFADVLNENTYKEIKKEKRSSSSNSQDYSKSLDDSTRLFIARGKKDGLDKSELIKSLSEKANIKKSSIKDVTVSNAFSFVSVPFKEAEAIIKAFKQEKVGNKPLIEKAKVKK